MEVAVAAIIAATAAAVGIAVLLCVYRLITLLGDPVNAKLDERLAKLDEREKAERPWGQDDPLINALGRLRHFYRGLRRHVHAGVNPV